MKNGIKLRPRDIKYIKALHELVIHQNKGTNKQYFLESKKIDELTSEECSLICKRCF